MEMIQIRTEIRGMQFPEKPSLEKSYVAGSQTKDLTLCRPVCYRLRHATSTKVYEQICTLIGWTKILLSTVFVTDNKIHTKNSVSFLYSCTIYIIKL